MANNPYAAFLNGHDAASLVRDFPLKLTAVLAQIGPERMSRSLAPGKWTVSEILCHLADCELAFSFRWRQTLAEDGYVAQSFDQDLWAPRYSSTPGDQALQTFLALRQWNLLLLERLTPQDWLRSLTHPELGQQTFQTLVEITAGHDLNHLAQLKTIAEGIEHPR